MLGLSLAVPTDAPLRVLCLGAHSDDIEIGCGGTVLRLCELYPRISFDWVVFSGDGARADEARRGAELFLGDALRRANVAVLGFRDGFFPDQWSAIKEYFEALKAEVQPDLILTHRRADLHQDHRVIAELTWNTFRGHLVLEYEIAKYDGDLGSPNVFVPLDAGIRQRKVEYLMTAFATQRDKRWFTEETFLGLMRLRGIECAAAEGYAEGFYGRKLVLGG